MSPPRSDVADLWRAIARLVQELGEASEHLVVIGGVVPSVLTADAPAAVTHWGTNDVDVLLVTDPTEALGDLEAGLTRARCVATAGGSGWQWGGRIEGQELILEIVCDVEGYASGQAVPLRGCSVLRAGNFRGPRYAAIDRTTVEWPLDDGTVLVPMTNIAGYLFAKAHALVARSLDKDFYDFAYVVIYANAGGPDELAREVRAGRLGGLVEETREIWVEVRARFDDAHREAPGQYAHFSRDKVTGSTPEQLRQDAVAGVQLFVDTLLPKG